MKKVIALALAMAMALSMSAMALTLEDGRPTGGATAPENTLFPGEKETVDTGLAVENFPKMSVKYDVTTGSGLVDSVKVVKGKTNWQLEVEIKENYTIDEAKDVVIEMTLTGTKEDGSKPSVGKYLSFQVANNSEDVYGASKRDDATAIDVEDNTIYKMAETGWVEFCGDGNRLSSVKARLPEDKKVFAYFNEDPIDEVEDKYYDLDADISYVNFVAKPSLGTKAEIAIQGDYSDKYHLYEYNNGKLTEIDADWNEDDGLFEFTASKLGAYVISDKALVAEADEDEKTDETTDETTESKNPDTGANDVVGVAVALAAVSLVAAGAVSLKK